MKKKITNFLAFLSILVFNCFYANKTNHPTPIKSNTIVACLAGTVAPTVNSPITIAYPNKTTNLNSAHTGSIPTGTSLVWFTNNTHSGNALTTTEATQALPGTYYAFYYDATNTCYSPSSNAVTVSLNYDSLDSDGDGIPNDYDADDDNDGILDVNECISVDRIINGVFVGVSLDGWKVDGTYATSGTFTSGDKVTLDVNGVAFYRDNSTLSTIAQNLTGISPRTIIKLSNLYWRRTNVNDTTSKFTVTISYGGTIYATIISDTTDTPSITASNGASVDTNALATLTSTGYSSKTNLSITLPGIIPNSGELKISFQAGTNDKQVRDFGFYSISTTSCKDTDGDGLSDPIDLDSDGDGCPDAREGSANFSASNLTTASGNLSSQTPNKNLGNNIDGNGVPTIAGVGQGVGVSKDYTQNNCTDSDGDNIADWKDLDDDNDGILDATECTNTEVYATYNFASILNGATNNATVTGINFGGTPATLTRVNTGTEVNVGVNFPANENFSNSSIYTPAGSTSQGVINETLKTFNNFPKETYYTTYKLKLENTSARSITLHLKDFDLMRTQFTGNHKEQLLSGGKDLVYDPAIRTLYDKDLTTLYSETNDGFGSVKITSIDGTSPLTEITFIKFDDPNINQGPDNFTYTFSALIACDSDGDGIVNRLDLDSDGDGCPDALENTGNFTINNLSVATGSLSTQNPNKNLGNTVDSNGVPTIAGASGKAIGISQNNFKNNCTDSDNDGVIDANDLDNDNDGILDTTECTITETYANLASTTITGNNQASASVSGIDFGNGITGILTRVNTNTTVNTALSTTTKDLSNATIYTPKGATSQSVFSEALQNFNNLPNNYTTYTLTLNKPAESITLHFYDFDFMRTRFTGDHKEQLLSGGTEVVYDSGSRILYDKDLSTYSSITRDGFGSIKIMSKNGSLIKTITYIKYDDPFSSFIADGFQYTFSVLGACDPDGDYIPSRLDLDSDGDGCPDAIEGGGTFSNADLVNSSLPGGNSGANYTGAYTSPVTSNLGNTVGSTTTTLGVPTIAGTGQTIGSSATADPLLIGGSAGPTQLLANNTGETPSPLSLTGYQGSTLQWQVSYDGINYTNISGANTSTYAPGPTTQKTYYRVLVTSAGGCTTYSNTAIIRVPPEFCYKSANIQTGTNIPSNHGITALGRAGAENGNWPMVRQSAWTVLEAKTKGFVLNRVKFNASNQPVADDGVTLIITNPVEGMAVYDTTNDCLKIYTYNYAGNTLGWYCVNKQSCP